MPLQKLKEIFKLKKVKNGKLGVSMDEAMFEKIIDVSAIKFERGASVNPSPQCHFGVVRALLANEKSKGEH